MTTRLKVTPNRRGMRSREVLLDTATSLMAEHGFEAATVSALVKGAGVSESSIYHYFGSKEGLLLAVMERGADRFLGELAERIFAGLGAPPAPKHPDPVQHLYRFVESIVGTIEADPAFLRLGIALVMQPATTNPKVATVIAGIRAQAVAFFANQMQAVFGPATNEATAEHLARVLHAMLDGAFIAAQSDPAQGLRATLQYLPTALMAIHREMVR